MKILLISDHLESVSQISHVLEMRHHIVTVSDTVDLGMESLQNDFYPLIFVDSVHPGLDALRFCRWLREQTLGDYYYLIVGTDKPRHRTLQGILQSGASDYFIKPYTNEFLDLRLSIAEQQVASLVKCRNLEDQLKHLQQDGDWVSRIREALRCDHFELWFQPIIDLKTNQVAYNEALLRLCDKDGEIIPPGEFLPSAERFKITREIDKFVIKKAAEYLRDDPELKLSINLSAESFDDPDLPQYTTSVFAVYDVDPSRVLLEITETQVMSNLEFACGLINRLHARGFRFALDDFGAGFSSFAQLKNLPVDYLKIDGTFISTMKEDPTNKVFVRAINEVAHHLNMKSIAEFVQDPETVDILKELNVDYAQGYHLGKPQPKELIRFAKA